jgi:hypothetical protein
MAMKRKYSTTILSGAKEAVRSMSAHVFEKLLLVGLAPGDANPRVLYQYPPSTSSPYVLPNVKANAIGSVKIGLVTVRGRS